MTKPPLLGVPAETEHGVVHGSLNCAVTPPGQPPAHLAWPHSDPSVPPLHKTHPKCPVQALHSQLCPKHTLRCLEKGWRTAEKGLRHPLLPKAPLFCLFLIISGTKCGHPMRDREATWLWVLPEVQPLQRAGFGEAQTQGEEFSAASRSWEPCEQQDLLTLHPQRVKSPSRRGAIWKRFCDRNFSSINP